MQARARANLSQRQLAERSSVSQQMISKLERGRSKESAGIVALAGACGVRSEWLFDGTGPMVTESETDPEVLRLARAIQTLSPRDRAHLQAVADAFLKSGPWDGAVERRKAGKGG
jgi:transcriptional regulator with XRE-family HTH domain